MAKDDDRVIKLVPEETMEQLDADEAWLRSLRVDTPGGSVDPSKGMVTISTNHKLPREVFFRSKPGVCIPIRMVVFDGGMEKIFCTVAPEMVDPLRNIKKYTALHHIYFTIDEEGKLRLPCVRAVDKNGNQNSFSRSAEIALARAESEWIRVAFDSENSDAERGYEVWPAEPGRFPEPTWPNLSEGKLIRMGFKDCGNHIDSTEHPLYKKWAGKNSE